MVITGQIVKDGNGYSAFLEPLFAYGGGRTREAARRSLVAIILEHAAETGPLAGFQVHVEDDGEQTLFVTSNDPVRLWSLLLRRQRTFQDLSLADVAELLHAKSRNGYAQYEQGRVEPSVGKLSEVLAVVAPDLVLAIIPRTARVIPRQLEHPELERVIADPSNENIAALRASLPVPPARKALEALRKKRSLTRRRQLLRRAR